MTLPEYLQKHFERGECTCRKCIDGGEKQPNGHTVDLTFFKVKAKESANVEDLRKLIDDQKGIHCEMNLFDGEEHSYIEVGGWIGDQGLALILIGAGHLMGLWKALSPDTTIPSLPDELKKRMAGQGMVTLKA